MKYLIQKTSGDNQDWTRKRNSKMGVLEIKQHQLDQVNTL